MIKHLTIKEEDNRFVIYDGDKRILETKDWKNSNGATSWLNRTGQPYLVHLPTGRTTAYNCQTYAQTHGSLDALLSSFLEQSPVTKEEIQRAIQLLRGKNVTPHTVKKRVRLEQLE